MTMKKWNKMIIFAILVFGMTFLVKTGAVFAKTSAVTIDLDKSVTKVKRLATLTKAKKVSVKSSRSSVVKVKYKKNKKDRRIIFTGKNQGTATVTVKCYLKHGKKKTYKYKITVKKSSKVSQSTKPVFAGTLTASWDDRGYVVLQYSKIANADYYVIQRRTESGAWKRMKTAWKTSYTDQTVNTNSVYYYRVQARVSGTYTQYSNEVKIQTGSIGNQEHTAVSTPTPVPAQTPGQSLSPTPMPTPTPYQAKYSYEISVLNQFTIYENVPIVLYVKTDNPNPNDFDHVYVNIGAYGEKVLGGPAHIYEDIEYLEQEETNTTYFRKVKGGWIYTCRAEEPGIHNVSIQELEKGENNNNTWQTVDSFQIEVQDGAASKKAFCDNVIRIVSDEAYDEDGMGKWSTLTEQQKMKRLESYIRDNMNYPRINTNGSYLGYAQIWILQENVGADWETGFTDCGGAAELLRDMATTLGIEACTYTTTMNGALHIKVKAIIGGEEYFYDATPWEGGYKDWDFIQLDNY